MKNEQDMNKFDKIETLFFNAYVFIDGANLWHSLENLGIRMQFDKLRNDVFGAVKSVRYYTALITDENGHNPARPTLDWLDYNGYTMITKPSKSFTNADGSIEIKGNMDIEIAVDIMRLAFSQVSKIEHIVLMTGDGDFRYLIQALQEYGIYVTVISSLSAIANELKRQADNVIYLEDLRDLITN